MTEMTDSGKETPISVPLHQEEIGDLILLHLMEADFIEANNPDGQQAAPHVWDVWYWRFERVQVLDQHVTNEMRERIAKQREENYDKLCERFGIPELAFNDKGDLTYE
jgi:hypothetical protein